MIRRFDYRELLGVNNPLVKYPKLFDAAVDEFSQRKFEDASLNDIIKKAEMSKGSLYHHFGDKFGLYLCMIDIIVEKKVAFFSSALKEKQKTGDFFGTVKQIIKATMEFMLVDMRFHHLFNNTFESSDDLLNKLKEYYDIDYSKWFGVSIDSAIKSEQIDNKYSQKFVSKMLQVLLTNLHEFLTTEGKPLDSSAESIMKVINQIIDFMQYGISAKI